MTFANPLKSSHPLWLIFGILVLTAGLWLVFWPPSDKVALGLAYGLGGSLVGWGSALAAIQLVLWRKTGIERMTAPAEVNAWLMLLFVGTITAVSLANSSLLVTGLSSRDAVHLAYKLGALVLFFVVLTHLLRVRREGAVLEDERDAQIRSRAVGWGRGALIFCVFGLMVMLGLSAPEKLEWATPVVIASQLWLALLCGWLVEYAAVIVQYWRDRSRL